MFTKKFEKILRITWFIIAFFLTIYLGYAMWKDNAEPLPHILIFTVTALLGYVCVNVLVYRSPIVSNLLGMSANIGEIYTHLLFGNVGMACSNLYYFMTHVFGLILWTKKKNQDQEGKIKVSKMNQKALVCTILFCIIGIILMFFLGDYFFKKDSPPYILLLNCIAFMIGVSAQFTMIMRQPFSWVLWSVSNLVWLSLNLISHNYIFAVQSILYEINALVGIYKWYTNSDN